MDAMEMKDQADEIAEAAETDRFHKRIAVVVAVVAVFIALCNVKDSNIVQAMFALQAQELDNWNQFQAKSTKQHLYELQVEQLELQMSTTLSASGREVRSRIDSQLRKWKGSIARYENEKRELKKKAEDAHDEYERLNTRDDQFDFADALLSLTIALLATAGLVRSNPLLFLACLTGLGGTIMGLAGFFGWSIHPGIIRFLT